MFHTADNRRSSGNSGTEVERKKESWCGDSSLEEMGVSGHPQLPQTLESARATRDPISKDKSGGFSSR